MAAYQVFVVSKAGASPVQRLAEMERAVVESVRWELNGPGGATFSIATEDPKAAEIKLLEREVQIWRDGALLWWGTPWAQRGDPRRTSYECEGLWAYFYRRLVKTTQTFTATDQLTIGWNLVSYAQTQHANGGLGVTSATFSPSGVNRDRTYPADEHGVIGDLVHAFTGLQNGYDFEIEVFGDGRREWTPYYPSKGTLRSEMVLEWGRNVLDYRYSKDARQTANDVIATGEGDAASRLEGTASDTTEITNKGLMTAVVNHPTVKETSTLTEHATEAVRVRKAPVVLPEIQVGNSPVATIGVLKTGDRVPVRISHGATQIDGTFRIVGIDLDPREERQWISLNAA